MWKRLKKYYYGWKYELSPTEIRLLALAAAHCEGVPPKEVYKNVFAIYGLVEAGCLGRDIFNPSGVKWHITPLGWKVLEVYAE